MNTIITNNEINQILDISVSSFFEAAVATKHVCLFKEVHLLSFLLHIYSLWPMSKVCQSGDCLCQLSRDELKIEMIPYNPAGNCYCGHPIFVHCKEVQYSTVTPNKRARFDDNVIAPASSTEKEELIHIAKLGGPPVHVGAAVPMGPEVIKRSGPMTDVESTRIALIRDLVLAQAAFAFDKEENVSDAEMSRYFTRDVTLNNSGDFPAGFGFRSLQGIDVARAYLRWWQDWIFDQTPDVCYLRDGSVAIKQTGLCTYRPSGKSSALTFMSFAIFRDDKICKIGYQWMTTTKIAIKQLLTGSEDAASRRKSFGASGGAANVSFSSSVTSGNNNTTGSAFAYTLLRSAAR